MMRNTILSATILLSGALALSVLAKADFSTPAFAQTITPKMHLEEGIKAVKANDKQGALMHLDEADKGLASSSSSSDQTPKMHLEEGIKAVKANDKQGALMHLDAADKALTG